MVQPRANQPALASVGAFLRGDRPEDGWSEAVDALGWRAVAEACDGTEPGRLVDDVIDAEGTDRWEAALGRLRVWLKAAEQATAPGIDEDAERWVEQVHAEAAACLRGVRLLEAMRAVGPRAGQAPAVAAAAEGGMLLAALWQHARRGAVSAFGPRCSVAPVFSQDEAGHFRFHRASVDAGPNATDRFVEYVLDVLDGAA
jgi:hypothetical protein